MIEIIVAIAVGIVIGWYAREQRAKLYLNHLERQMNQSFSSMVAEAAKHIIQIEITKQGDMFYVHNKTTGEFLAQGRDHDTITEILNSRFPDMTFMANPDDLEKIGYTK